MAFSQELLDAAQHPWQPRPGRAGRQTMTLFTPVWTQRLFFDGHPALPYLLGVPLIALTLEHAAPVGVLPALLWGAFGVLLWTLTEYAMHRFLFHFESVRPEGKVAAFLVHGHHHVTPLETARLAATPGQMASALVLLWGVLALAVPAAAHAPAFVGLVVGYLAYEALHHHAHHGRPRWRLFQALQRHHLKHHYESPNRRWGISTPLWDWVFRTL